MCARAGLPFELLDGAGLAADLRDRAGALDVHRVSGGARVPEHLDEQLRGRLAAAELLEHLAVRVRQLHIIRLPGGARAHLQHRLHSPLEQYSTVQYSRRGVGAAS